MLQFFRRSVARPVRSAAAANAQDSPPEFEERRFLPRPMPVAVVVEGSDESDWALWEESVWQLEKQMQFPAASA
jgi:hypothetical protein